MNMIDLLNLNLKQSCTYKAEIIVMAKVTGCSFVTKMEHACIPIQPWSFQQATLDAQNISSVAGNGPVETFEAAATSITA